MAVIQTGNHPRALWPGINAWFGLKYDEHPKEYTDLFTVYKSRKNYELDVQSVGFGLAPQKAEGTPLYFDDNTQGYESKYQHIAYALGYIVTKEELDDNLYEEVSMRRSESLAFSMNQTKETVSANVYNRAFNSAFVGGDGKELLATDHPLTGGGTFSNELSPAADLSEAALEDLIIQIHGAVNDRGLKIALRPKSLIVPRQLFFEANRIMKSTLQNDTANNAINVLKATNAIPEGIKLNHYLTDEDAWFVKTNAPHGMKMFERNAINFEQDNDFDTKNAKSSAYERYSVGWTDPRGLFGSEGA
jgi:hypothetical protein